jgi:hypothetical protein
MFVVVVVFCSKDSCGAECSSWKLGVMIAAAFG